MVSPQIIPNWTVSEDPPCSFTGARVESLGAEPVNINTLELLAVSSAIAVAAYKPVHVVTDSGYVISGLHRLHERRTRKILRTTERPLWESLKGTLGKRDPLLPVAVQKCSSHLKDAEQDPGITFWNDVADRLAKGAANLPVGSTDPWPEGELEYSLLHRGKAIRSDPRRHIRDSFERSSLDHACTLGSGGMFARIMTQDAHPFTPHCVEGHPQPTQTREAGGTPPFGVRSHARSPVVRNKK